MYIFRQTLEPCNLLTNAMFQLTEQIPFLIFKLTMTFDICNEKQAEVKAFNL